MKRNILSKAICGGILLSSLVSSAVNANELNSSNLNDLIFDYGIVLDEDSKAKLSTGEFSLRKSYTEEGYLLELVDKDGNVDSSIEVEEISTEQVIKNLVEKEKIDYNDAKKQIEKTVKEVQERYSNEEISRETITKNLSWLTVNNTKKHPFNVYNVETKLSADLLAYRSGSFGSIEDVKSVFFRVINNGNSTIESSNARHKVAKFPTTSVPLDAEGTLKITTNKSISTQLKLLGFTVTAGTSGSYHCRKEIRHSYTYKI